MASRFPTTSLLRMFQNNTTRGREEQALDFPKYPMKLHTHNMIKKKFKYPQQNPVFNF